MYIKYQPNIYYVTRKCLTWPLDFEFRNGIFSLSSSFYKAQFIIKYKINILIGLKPILNQRNIINNKYALNNILSKQKYIIYTQ